MGLFDKKYCDICGEKIGLLGNRKLEDGNLCKDCAKKLSPWFSDRRRSTVEDIKGQLAYREENREKAAQFCTTRSFGEDWKVLLDEDDRWFTVTRARDLAEANPDILDFDAITGCRMDIDESRTELTCEDADGKDVSYVPPRYEYSYDFFLVISVRHPYFDEMRFSLNSSSVYENQKAYYTEKIMANPNWTMADIFADEGITGTSACKRKDFLRMIRQCRKGKIDMILAKSVSRFARNTVDTLSYTRELRSMGIPVIFEEQNINSIYPESEFLITIHGAFAQSESEGISSRVKWGKHQAMRTGKANIQYKTLLGYEKGPDGEMVVNAEQAETVRKIYELYLSGQTLRNIKETLETGGFKNSAGTTEWTTSNLRTILSDEKYCGDVLLQKTFIRDCISKQVIRNTGQLPMYLIQNHHEAIIPRERFDAVQIELARRRAQTGGTKKSAPTGMSRYSGKYALSGLLFCGECGTAYRRVVWTQHGEKRAVSEAGQSREEHGEAAVLFSALSVDQAHRTRKEQARVFLLTLR